MKKLLFAALLAASLQVQAQESSTLMNRDFWQKNPDIALIKSEFSKGFDFKNVHGASDPIFLSITTEAPAAIIKYLIDQPGVDLTHTTVEGRIYLHIAAQKANAEIVDYLIAKGSDVNMLDANGQTALSFAAFGGSLTKEVLDVFLKNGFDIHHKYKAKDDANLLLLAVGNDKDLSLTNYMVSKGVSLHSKDSKGYTAFDHATKIGNLYVLKTLLEKGVKYNEAALLLAAQGTFRTVNKLEVYQYLVDELKINPLVTNAAGQNVLHLVSRKQNQADIIKYFVNKGVNINQVDRDGNTPFIVASGSKSLEAVETMLPKVKNINAVNAKGESALLNAVKGSTGAVVSLLLKNNANTNVADKEGHNLGFYLVESYRAPGGRGGRGPAPQNNAVPVDDFADKLKALQAIGFDFKSAQKDGNTLYHLAAAKGDVEVLKKLASVGIDVNAKNKEGVTALHKAVMVAKNDASIKYLLSLGAKKDIKTGFGETAYELAQENEFLSKNNVSIDFLK
jgi:ankyrin repeat protein